MWLKVDAVDIGITQTEAGMTVWCADTVLNL